MADAHTVEPEIPFRFLDLSAELRNHVYAFCRPSRIHCNAPKSNTDCVASSLEANGLTVNFDALSLGNDNEPRWCTESHQIGWSSTGSNDAGLDCKTAALSFFHFAHVCRRIRAEFRPIYLADTAVPMNSGRLTSYLDTFYQGWHDSNIDKSDWAGNINIASLTPWIDNGEDFLPYIRLLSEAPGMHISIPRTNNEIGEQIRRLFKFRSSWSGWTDGKIEEVSLVVKDGHVYHPDIPEFQVLFGRKCVPPWAYDQQIGPGTIEVNKEAATAFLESLGFHVEEEGIYWIWAGFQKETDPVETIWWAMMGS
ncbi:hypothetical protein HBI72_143030 [Parastagonospora nodorum]|nr:hypothetical protein HBI72_143030 [Parastagonospora nodorum]